MNTAIKLFGTPCTVGQIIACSSVTDTAVPAKRRVNADGSPRTDLVNVRVVKLVTDNRRLSADNIRDGARHADYAIVEVVS